ncbi:nuclear transport factor 2 family protein [Nitratireductor mangrovi]|uniref:Nuclear transport factor 2 family protein n=1 Tax=Nitratireductor mangrovi TaxID=2599600 RepID=A0A5B8L0B6_9HYPH|nr:nuclear transport factor 2 family protein [Nitratireductor mangrovi]QDZ00988.2 nuclear transport factor 2 family protein [Nitratireductor mangrovi]
MHIPAQAAMERLFKALEARDTQKTLDCFARDAFLFDPHYPKPDMRGHEEIRAGIEWGLSVMQRFHFTIVNVFAGRDGDSAAIEVDTSHVLKGGRELSFPQVFVVETRGGLVTRLQAYEPYGPNGIGGLFLGVERLKRRLFG